MRRGAALAVVLLGLVPAPVAWAEPRLEPGFPVESWIGGGTYGAGASVAITVGSIDDDPEPEVLASGMASGPLNAFNGDGSTVAGWPRKDTGGFVYSTLGNLSTRSPGFEVFGASWAQGALDDRLLAWAGDGTVLPGWPRTAVNYVDEGAALADLDADGLDEVLLDEVSGRIEGHRADGSSFWNPFGSGTTNDETTPAVGDLDRDGRPEVVSAADDAVFARTADGEALPGFPVRTSNAAYVTTWPVIGDVDGDGRLEVVVVQRRDGRPRVVVIGPGGAVERDFEAAGTMSYGSAPSLADLTGDGTPEILVETDGTLGAWTGTGTPVPGFPVSWGGHALGDSQPVVGDIDGDQQPDVVVVSAPAGQSYGGQVRAYSNRGALLPGFPLSPDIGTGDLCPAIADIDGNGRNEVLVAGHGSQVTSFQPYLWSYDLGGPRHGRVEWGQFGGGPQHQGRYGAPTAPAPAPALVGSPAGATLVTDLRPGARGSDPGPPAVLGGALLFAADDGATGRELWTTDGTPGGTRRVLDLRAGAAGADPRQLVSFGGAVYFTADDGVAGRELWRTDGTAGGTRMVADVWPGAEGSRIDELAVAGGALWFSGWDGQHGPEPWRSDGTAAGTRLVADLVVGVSATPGGAGSGSGPEDFTTVSGGVAFRAYRIDSGTSSAYEALYRSDGTAGGTRTVGDTGFSGDYDPYLPGDVEPGAGGLLLSNGTAVGSSDGDTAASFPASSGDGLVDGLTTLSASRSIWGMRGDLGRRIWRSGGAGTALEGAADPLAPTALAALGSRATLTATDGAHGQEPWVSDGTAAGTSMLRDVDPGPRGSSPSPVGTVGSERLLSADDGVHGHELWASDGTPAGTRRITDLAPGPRSADVRWAVPVGGRLVLAADDGARGRELHVVALPLVPADPPPPPPPPATTTTSTTPPPPPPPPPPATTTTSTTPPPPPPATTTGSTTAPPPPPATTTTSTTPPPPPPATTTSTTTTPPPGATGSSTTSPADPPAPPPGETSRGGIVTVPVTPGRLEPGPAGAPRPVLTRAALTPRRLRRGAPLVLRLAARGAVRVVVRVKRSGPPRRVVARRGLVLGRGGEARLRLATRGLRPGRHVVEVVAVDGAGHQSVVRALALTVLR